MATATLTFEADLKGAATKFIEMARSVRNVKDGVKQLTRETGRMARQLERTGRAAKRTYSDHETAVDRGIGKVTQFMGAYFSLQAGINATRAALENYHQEQEHGAQFLKET